MKTSDLIPLILLELSIDDKYGLDLTKSIETKSGGKISIKQPTLYTILKKLEKSKFISSYWKDSEIGGKRHYYRLTENGKHQVSTLPPYDQLIKNILAEDEVVSDDVNISSPTESNDFEIKPENTSINDEPTDSIFDALSSEPKETVLPTQEIFADNSIDNTTTHTVNTSNIEILKEAQDTETLTFASNENVARFTKENQPSMPDEYKTKLKDLYSNSLSSPTPKANQTAGYDYHDIKYVEYKDSLRDENRVYERKIKKLTFFKILSTCAYLILALIICGIVTKFTGTSALYNVFLIISICLIVFYPSIFIFKAKQSNNLFKKYPYTINIKRRLLISICIELSLLILLFVINLSIGRNSITKILSIHNFANIYAIILMSLVTFVDLGFSYLFLVKVSKDNNHN